jgi:hypothetical protein
VIAPGSIVKCRQTGATAWAVERQLPDGLWRLVGKQVTQFGGEHFIGRTAGGGDLSVVTPSPSYEVGSSVIYAGE